MLHWHRDWPGLPHAQPRRAEAPTTRCGSHVLPASAAKSILVGFGAYGHVPQYPLSLHSGTSEAMVRRKWGGRGSMPRCSSCCRQSRSNGASVPPSSRCKVFPADPAASTSSAAKCPAQLACKPTSRAQLAPAPGRPPAHSHARGAVVQHGHVASGAVNNDGCVCPGVLACGERHNPRGLTVPAPGVHAICGSCARRRRVVCRMQVAQCLLHQARQQCAAYHLKM